LEWFSWNLETLSGSREYSSGRTLAAPSRFGLLTRALQASPAPPAPIAARISYGPSSAPDTRGTSHSHHLRVKLAALSRIEGLMTSYRWLRPAHKCEYSNRSLNIRWPNSTGKRGLMLPSASKSAAAAVLSRVWRRRRRHDGCNLWATGRRLLRRRRDSGAMERESREARSDSVPCLRLVPGSD
jgi:hypothetical protein